MDDETTKAAPLTPDPARDWPGGDYACTCWQCGSRFFGAKMARVCMACKADAALAVTPVRPPSSPGDAPAGGEGWVSVADAIPPNMQTVGSGKV